MASQNIKCEAMVLYCLYISEESGKINIYKTPPMSTFKDLFIFYLHVAMCICAQECRCQLRPEDGIILWWAVVKGCWKAPAVGAASELRLSIEEPEVLLTVEPSRSPTFPFNLTKQFLLRGNFYWVQIMWLH